MGRAEVQLAYSLALREQLHDDVAGVKVQHQLLEHVVVQVSERGEHEPQRLGRRRPEDARLHHEVAPLVHGQLHDVRSHALSDAHLELLVAMEPEDMA